MRVRRLDDICPDGITISLPLGKMEVGESVFIPCVNTVAAKEQLRKVFQHRGWDYMSLVGPDNGVWGVRVWRKR